MLHFSFLPLTSPQTTFFPSFLLSCNYCLLTPLWVYVQIYRQYCNGNMQVNFGGFPAGFWQNCLRAATYAWSQGKLELPYCGEKSYLKEPKTSSLRSELSFDSVSSGHCPAVLRTLVGLPCVARNDLDWGLLLKREVPASPHPGEHEPSFLRSGCLQWKPLMSHGLGSHLKRSHFFSGSSILIPHPASDLWLWASFMSWFSLQLKWASPSHWGPP